MASEKYEIEPFRSDEIKKVSATEFLARMQKIQVFLNKEPDKEQVAKYSVGNVKFDYLPISHIEMLLDEAFFGQWSIVDFNYLQVCNEIIGSLTLEVIHPVSGMRIKRVGCGAVQIKQDKDTHIKDFLQHKKKNALQMDFPRLKAECFKNAALTLGKQFGRDMRRDETDEFTPLIDDQQSNIEKVIKALDTYKGTDREELKAMAMEKKEAEEFDSMFTKEIMGKIKDGSAKN